VTACGVAGIPLLLDPRPLQQPPERMVFFRASVGGGEPEPASGVSARGLPLFGAPCALQQFPAHDVHKETTMVTIPAAAWLAILYAAAKGSNNKLTILTIELLAVPIVGGALAYDLLAQIFPATY